jgi:hypothetical protein
MVREGNMRKRKTMMTAFATFAVLSVTAYAVGLYVTPTSLAAPVRRYYVPRTAVPPAVRGGIAVDDANPECHR